MSSVYNPETGRFESPPPPSLEPIVKRAVALVRGSGSDGEFRMSERMAAWHACGADKSAVREVETRLHLELVATR